MNDKGNLNNDRKWFNQTARLVLWITIDMISEHFWASLGKGWVVSDWAHTVRGIMIDNWSTLINNDHRSMIMDDWFRPPICICFHNITPNHTPNHHRITYITSLHTMSTEAQVPPELVQFKLTMEDLEILEVRKEEWWTGDHADRNKIANKVYDEMKKKNPHWSREDKDLRKRVSLLIWQCFSDGIEWNIVQQGVYTWFHTYRWTREWSEKFKSIKKWTGRRVLAVQAKGELKKTIQGKTGGWVEVTSCKLDNQKAFSTYQKELSNLWDQTLVVEKKKMEDLADIWNQMGPPVEEQAKYDLHWINILLKLMPNRNANQAYKHVKSFCKQMKKSCGMDCLVLTCHKDMNGVLVMNALSLFILEVEFAS